MNFISVTREKCANPAFRESFVKVFFDKAEEFFFGQSLELSISFLNADDEDIVPFFVEGGMATERCTVLRAVLWASADCNFVHVKDERELRGAKLMTKTFRHQASRKHN
jgi:hypothetical protein